MRLLMWFGIVGVLFGQTNPFAGDSAAIDVGKGNFRLYCAPCHGIHAQGGRGPDLTRGTFASGDSDAELYRVIAHGVEGTEMTSYQGRFDDPMIWRFVSFIRSVTKKGVAAAPGDPVHGRKLFEGKGGCSGCHTAGATGGGIGPGLARVGRQRSLEYLQEKLVNPSVSLTPGYNTIIVRLHDGREIRGVEKGFDDFSAQLLDAKGQYHSYRREEVASMKREERSMMPSAAAQKLSAPEQTDLVAYLASLRGGK